MKITREGEELNRRFAPVLKQLEYLHDRWQDEKEYEDWNDYVTEMKKVVPEGATFIQASKKPFGFSIRVGNGGVRFRVSSTKASWDMW